jgi:cytochrome b6-f complex iron-sulfur subunit
MVLGAAAFGWVASLFYPIIRYLTPLPDAGPMGPSRLTSDEVTALERDNFVIVPASGKRVLVFLNRDGKLGALDARCTHEGCTVQYNANDEVVWCACHNALFDVDGRVLSGPPPKPLPQYHVDRNDENEIVVTTEQA